MKSVKPERAFTGELPDYDSRGALHHTEPSARHGVKGVGLIGYGDKPSAGAVVVRGEVGLMPAAPRHRRRGCPRALCLWSPGIRR
ncbi:hypothetical protein ACGFZQ_39310 [Streptomyces sp. NPDC048254]|uniref:hypothetical protein n=1 Tax=Streptomyces sp. NPDC048254 TaxID=3365525 RepID=UPI0037185C79